MENSYLQKLLEDETNILRLSGFSHYELVEDYNIAMDQIIFIKNILEERVPDDEIDKEFLNQVVEELDVDEMHINILINAIFEENLIDDELNQVLDEICDEYFKINLTLVLVMNYLNYEETTQSRDIAIMELDSLEKSDFVIIPSQLDYTLPNEELLLRDAYEITLDYMELINNILTEIDYQEESNQEFIKDLTNLKQELNVIYIYLNKRTKIMENPTDEELIKYLSETFNIISRYTRTFKIVENLFKDEGVVLETDIKNFIDAPLINTYDDSVVYVKDIETGAELPDAIMGLMDDTNYFLTIVDSITDEVDDTLEKDFLKTIKKVLTIENDNLKELYLKPEEKISQLGLKTYLEELSLTYINLIEIKFLIESYLPFEMNANLEFIALTLLDLEDIEEPVYEYKNEEKIENPKLQKIIDKTIFTINNVSESKKLLETKFNKEGNEEQIFKLKENLQKIYGYSTSIYNYLSEYDDILLVNRFMDLQFHLNVLLASLNFAIRANHLINYLNNPKGYILRDECVRFIEKMG